jgi:hypothetical protein
MKQTNIIKLFDITRQTWTNWKKQDKKIVQLLNYFNDFDLEYLILEDRIPKMVHLDKLYTNLFSKYTKYISNLLNDTDKSFYESLDNNFDEVYNKIFLHTPIFFIFELVLESFNSSKIFHSPDHMKTNLIRLYNKYEISNEDIIELNSIFNIDDDICIILSIFSEEKNFNLYYNYIEPKSNFFDDEKNISKEHKRYYEFWLKIKKLKQEKLEKSEKMKYLKILIQNINKLDEDSFSIYEYEAQFNLHEEELKKLIEEENKNK